MSWQRRIILGLALLNVIVLNVTAQNSSSASPNSQPPAHSQPEASSSVIAPTPSPVAFFRKLLAMSPTQREDYLTNRPPQMRERILAKVREYELLSPDDRELRLRATELRWYLMPLLQTSQANRDAGLARVPAELREIVKNRLDQWDILPPPLKDEFLENEQTRYYFARIQPPANSAAAQELAAQRERISEEFRQFLELTPEEKQQTLDNLSADERAQMQKTLESFGKLTPEQQTQCVQNYAKFAGMSAADRVEFLRNAERWSQMSPAERQTWRDLVANVPDWPPVPPSIYPPGLAPPGSPVTPVISRSSVATN
jgi:hypothetical protein